MMKKINFNRLTNLILISVVGILLIQKIPTWIRNFQMDGAPVQTFSVVDASGGSVSLPVAGKKQVVIFWATWCGPCTLELLRFNSAVKDGELSADQVIAVSFGEDPAVVYKEVAERDYKFTVLVDPEPKTTLPVEGTPTTYHIDETGVIKHASVGASLIPVWRAKWFLL